jgi:hypothetical protein
MKDDYDAELRDWAIQNASGYTVAFGRVFSDREGRWPDGHMIRTSTLTTSGRKDGDIIVTLNTRYKLSGPPMASSELTEHLGTGRANYLRRERVADDERLFDLLQAAWGLEDREFEIVAGLPKGWLWQWRNHYRAPTDDDLARVRRLARFHDALRIVAYGGPKYRDWWRRRWREDSLIGARTPLDVVLENPNPMLDKLTKYLWAQM